MSSIDIDIEDRLIELMGRDELENKISKIELDYLGLLKRRAILYLIGSEFSIPLPKMGELSSYIEGELIIPFQPSCFLNAKKEVKLITRSRLKIVRSSLKIEKEVYKLVFWGENPMLKRFIDSGMKGMVRLEFFKLKDYNGKLEIHGDEKTRIVGI